jgi:hypothetical protein
LAGHHGASARVSSSPGITADEKLIQQRMDRARERLTGDAGVTDTAAAKARRIAQWFNWPNWGNWFNGWRNW